MLEVGSASSLGLFGSLIAPLTRVAVTGAMQHDDGFKDLLTGGHTGRPGHGREVRRADT